MKQTMYLKVSVHHRPMLLTMAGDPNPKLEMFIDSRGKRLGQYDDDYTLQPHRSGNGDFIGIAEGCKTIAGVAEPLIKAQPNVTMENGYMISYYTDEGIVTEICGQGVNNDEDGVLRIL